MVKSTRLSWPPVLLLIVSTLLSGCAAGAPSADTSGRPEAVAFAQHRYDEDRNLYTAALPLYEAITARSWAASDAAASVLGEYTGGELAWLDSHPPTPCYEEAYRLYRAALQGHADAAHLLHEAATAKDMELAERAVIAYNEADTVYGQSTTALAAVRCGGQPVVVQ